MISAISLALRGDPSVRAGQWSALIVAALENGVNAFEVIAADPALVQGLSDGFTAVERRAGVRGLAAGARRRRGLARGHSGPRPGGAAPDRPRLSGRPGVRRLRRRADAARVPGAARTAQAGPPHPLRRGRRRRRRPGRPARPRPRSTFSPPRSASPPAGASATACARPAPATWP
ncbi:MAG: hypothetical protein WDM92_11805 [Caulobacteraceae bacterium]